MNIPADVENFIDRLNPMEVGVDTVGDYVVHYEGFTDECNDGHDDNSIDEVYAEVFQDFDDRQGEEALIRGVANDSLGCDNNPVLYSVYGKLKESNLDFKLLDNEISEAMCEMIKDKDIKIVEITATANHRTDLRKTSL